ncbi:MAG: acireductone synthase [Hyphomicrobiales bacterium]|nr:acireductone synthase [Hyphomicrobiales bacterium]
MRFAADAVLLDIEGTISSIAFMRNVLFAYSRERLADFVADHRRDPAIDAILCDASALGGGGDPVAALLQWQDRDEKAPPLKKLQGMIWESGYRTGAFQSSLFPDAFAALKRWKASGLPLYIYSSGSVQAQALFFQYNEAGDLQSMFSVLFDTDMGAKTDSASYIAIAEQIGLKPGRIIFFSDNPGELSAAGDAALQVVHVIKEHPGDARFPAISDFSDIEITRGV